MSVLWSDVVHRLNPYLPGEQPDRKDLIKLNTNENPYGPSPRALAAVQQCVDDELRLYPDAASRSLRTAIAAHHGLTIDEVFVGNGSDEVLALAFQSFFSRSEPLLFPEITYSFYPTYCDLFGITSRTIVLDKNFGVDLSLYDAPLGGVIFPNPNAPTSVAIAVGAISELLERIPDRVIMVDEAYVDFGCDSAVPLIRRFPNLLVIQTFSKSRSLAGLRIGMAMGHPSLIEALMRVKNSFNAYPLDTLAQVAAQAAMADHNHMARNCQRIIATRERVARQLTRLGFTILPSATNFLFVTHPSFDAAALQTGLREAGILVRHWHNPLIKDYLRISIGTDEQMERLLQCMTELLAGGGSQ